MKARKLIADTVFDPDELKVIGKAFDDAWQQVAWEVTGRPMAVEAARLKLAEIVLSLAKTGTRDPALLTEEAVRRMLAGPTQLRP
jgi:hypothetical protein